MTDDGDKKERGIAETNLSAPKFTVHLHTNIPVDRKAIIRFLRCCRGLSASYKPSALGRNLPPMIELTFEAGELILRQIGVPTSEIQLTLATNLPEFFSFQPVVFLAKELARPLRIIDHIQLDFIYEKVLVLRSESPWFKWITKGF